MFKKSALNKVLNIFFSSVVLLQSFSPALLLSPAVAYAQDSTNSAVTASPTPTPVASPSATLTPTPTAAPSPTPTPTVVPSATPTPTATPTLSATPTVAPSPTPTTTASISTNKTRYFVGEPMTISGIGFTANANITISVLRPDHVTDTLSAKADGSGAFSVVYSPLAIPGRYKITATDGVNSANTATTQADAVSFTFDQCAQNDKVGNTPLGLGFCNWIGSELNSGNSKLFEGIATEQQLIMTSMPTGAHTLVVGIQATKGGNHAYDWLVSDAKASGTIGDSSLNSQKASAADGITLNLNRCGDSLGTQAKTDCNALISGASGANTIDIPVPDDPFISSDGSTQTRINAYEALFGDRTVRLYTDGTVTGTPTISLVHMNGKSSGSVLTNGGDTGDSYIWYTINWNSTGTKAMLVAGADIALGGDGTGRSWGAGRGASAISGSPYHFYLISLDGVGGSQDNQMASSAVFQPPITPTVTTQAQNASNTNITNTSVAVGTVVHDHAVVDTGVGHTVPTGSTFTFNRYNNGTCAGTPDNIQSGVSVPSGGQTGAADSNTFTPGVGSFSYLVDFHSGGASVTDKLGNPSTDCEPFTIISVTPTVTTAIHDASHNVVTSVALGATVHDSVTVTGTSGTPTGNVTFDFFNNGTCANAPTATSGNVALSSGTADATGFPQGPLAAGSYSFKAHYAGSAPYVAGDGPCEPLTVNKAQLGVTTIVHDAAHTDKTNSSVPLGSVMHDTATVTGGVAGFTVPTPTFTLTSAYTSSCANGAAVANNGTEGSAAKSADSAALGAGNYAYRAVVAGDSNYLGATSDCEPFTVNKAQLGVATAIHDASHAVITSAPLGSIVHDTAALTGVVGGFTPTGAVTFTFDKSPSLCGTTAIATAGSLDGGNPASVDTASLTAGSYNFRASVAGDSNYLGATSSCEPLTIAKADLNITTTVHSDSPDQPLAGNLNLGDGAHDSASVAGKVGSLTLPDVTFYFFGKGVACTNGDTTGGTVLNTVSPDGSGIAHPSTSETALAAGTYNFMAVVASNDNYNAKISDCEPFTVNKAQLTISTGVHDAAHNVITSADLFSVVHDTAVIGGTVGGFAPTGAVTFTFDKSPSGCGTTAIATSGSLDGGKPRSVDTSALVTGNYNFRGAIAGDDNYLGATSSCEPLTINQGTSGTTTVLKNVLGDATIANGSSVAVGSSVYDTAAVAPTPAGTPTGTVTYKFYSQANCGGTSTDQTVTLSGGVVPNSSSQGPLSPGNYGFKAIYSGDSNYAGSTGDCEPFNVVDARITLTPLTATNEVNHNHIITATVSQNSGSGIVAAPDGTLVTFSLANNNAGATFVGGVNTCTTVGGTCSVTINTSTAGSVDIHGTTTFGVGGVSLTRATGDGLSGDSSDAHKTYIDLKITIDSNSTNEVGKSHTFTVTVGKNLGDGSGFVPADGLTVTPGISGAGSLTGTGTCQTGATDVSGQCTIIVNSSSTGTGTIGASTSWTFNGVTVTRALGDSLSGDSEKATKTWVDANIALTPLDATNNIGSPHTVTVTVMKNAGTGFVAAAGEHVDFTLTPSGATPVVDTAASTCDDAGANTNSSGQCVIVFNSATPGTVTIGATVTLTVGGVSLTRSSGDGKTGDSANANKTYVAGSLTITKTLDVSQYPVLGLPNVDQTFTVHVTGPSFDPTGTDVHFTVVDGVLQSPSSVTLSPLIPGTYNVAENNPGIAWTVTGGGAVTVVANQTATSTVNNALKQPHTTISITPNTFETLPGENVILTIIDTNDGQVPLNNPTVVLTYGGNTETLSTVATAHCTAATESGTVNGIMDVGESWTWTCTILISSNTTFSVAGHGTDSFRTDISAANGVTSESASTTVNVIGTTRTLGFWQTHTTFTSYVFGTIMGSSMPIGTAPHRGVLTTTAQIFGGFYAPIAKTSTGAKRNPVDQARITLLQQLLAAKLNCAAFGCSSTVLGQIATADIDYAAGNKSLILLDVSILDAYNNSGDNNAIPSSLPPTGKATPKDSQFLANIAFWDLP